MQLSLPKDLYMPDYEAEKGKPVGNMSSFYIVRCTEFLT
jgi:hypothetical protein